MPSCYILFSKKLNRFYVGATRESAQMRLEQHLGKLFGNKGFTAKAQDWSIFLEIPCASFELSLKIEKHIKKMKSKNYILNLKKYPDLVNNLISNITS